MWGVRAGGDGKFTAVGRDSQIVVKVWGSDKSALDFGCTKEQFLSKRTL